MVMLMGCGVEKTGESGSVEATIRYCFYIKIVHMFFRIRLPVTVVVPIFYTHERRSGHHDWPSRAGSRYSPMPADYRICMYLGDKVASPRGFELIPRIWVTSESAIFV